MLTMSLAVLRVLRFAILSWAALSDPSSSEMVNVASSDDEQWPTAMTIHLGIGGSQDCAFLDVVPYVDMLKLTLPTFEPNQTCMLVRMPRVSLADPRSVIFELCSLGSPFLCGEAGSFRFSTYLSDILRVVQRVLNPPNRTRVELDLQEPIDLPAVDARCGVEQCLPKLQGVLAQMEATNRGGTGMHYILAEDSKHLDTRTNASANSSTSKVAMLLGGYECVAVVLST